MVKSVLDEIEKVFIEFIDFLNLELEENSSTKRYVEYVKENHGLFKDNNCSRKSNWALNQVEIIRAISRYSDEFYWRDRASRKKLREYLVKLTELVALLE